MADDNGELFKHPASEPRDPTPTEFRQTLINGGREFEDKFGKEDSSLSIEEAVDTMLQSGAIRYGGSRPEELGDGADIEGSTFVLPEQTELVIRGGTAGAVCLQHTDGADMVVIAAGNVIAACELILKVAGFDGVEIYHEGDILPPGARAPARGIPLESRETEPASSLMDPPEREPEPEPDLEPEPEPEEGGVEVGDECMVSNGQPPTWVFVNVRNEITIKQDHTMYMGVEVFVHFIPEVVDNVIEAIRKARESIQAREATPRR